ncbi:Smp-30/Cgr1 family protein [Pseudoalteromonas sp. BSi20652]|uniref:SMP-30/gluconolactonase/LRE family protein n=1 Tax=Pseudoalteromonas sp. BSi20652 TaxID=388384 RepID=UPI0002318123|nr:SMP-30/gluconolactonase/LRE family protein [Pseudoalteromonas sp. BSi20652]GAA61747.1 Smp-30/Cgr1 family protein [Pseudoalteromonas sp. BSi20652]
MFDFKVTVFNNTQNQLGESPLWHPLLDTLFWVDIDKKILYSRKEDSILKNDLNDTSIVKQVTMDDTVTALAWLNADYLILGTNTGIYRHHINNETQELIVAIEKDESNTRSNDGRADPWGGFWLSTMHVDAKKGQGKIYRYYKHKLKCIVNNLTIPNGLCFDKARLRGYYCDSFASCIYMIDLDEDTGAPCSEPRVFYQFSNANVDPDGCVTDTLGNLWVAVWGMGCVMCLSSKGKLITTIKLCAIKPTCTAFGGKNAELLLVTSAFDDAINNRVSTQGVVFQISGIKNGQFEPPVIL